MLVGLRLTLMALEWLMKDLEEMQRLLEMKRDILWLPWHTLHEKLAFYVECEGCRLCPLMAKALVNYTVLVVLLPDC